MVKRGDLYAVTYIKKGEGDGQWYVANVVASSSKAAEDEVAEQSNVERVIPRMTRRGVLLFADDDEEERKG